MSRRSQVQAVREPGMAWRVELVRPAARPTCGSERLTGATKAMIEADRVVTSENVGYFNRSSRLTHGCDRSVPRGIDFLFYYTQAVSR